VRTRAHTSGMPRKAVLDSHQGVRMEALLIVSLFVALALLAAHFGHDSREHLPSSEEAFARLGFAWRGDRS
jgi:hypothetical protein